MSFEGVFKTCEKFRRSVPRPRQGVYEPQARTSSVSRPSLENWRPGSLFPRRPKIQPAESVRFARTLDGVHLAY